jgi:hypothetical protein
VLLLIEMKRNKEGTWGKKGQKKKEKKMEKENFRSFMGGGMWGRGDEEDNPKWHYH